MEKNKDVKVKQEVGSSENEAVELTGEELDAVAGGGGLWDITIYDRCSNDNPDRNYKPALCKECSHFKMNYVSAPLVTECYCGKTQKVMYTYRGYPS